MKLVYSLIYIALLGLLSHFIGQALPRAAFSAERFPYKAASWEKGGKAYEKLAIRHGTPEGPSARYEPHHARHGEKEAH